MFKHGKSDNVRDRSEGTMKHQRDLMQPLESRNVAVQPVFFWSFAALCLVVFFLRLFFTVDFYDEFFNTAIAYQSVLGHTFLSDIWNFFQTGDAIQIPFLWLYRSINGSMEGVLLAGRIYYFVCCCLIGLFAYRTFRSNSAIAGTSLLLIACFAPFSLSYWWYDSVMIQFSLLGCLFVFRALSAERKPSVRLNLLLAGLFHAWMVFAYPLTILIVAYVLIYLALSRRSARPVLWYLFGSLLLLGMFLAYCAGIGFERLFLFRQGSTSASGSAIGGLSGREYLFQIGGYLSRIKNAVLTILRMSVPSLVTLSVSAILILVSFWKRAWKACLFVLLLQPFLPLFFSLGQGSYDTLLYWAYFFELAIVLWPVLRRSAQKVLADRLFLLFWLPSTLAFCAVALTAYGDSNAKGMLGFYCGALCGFLLFILLVQVVLQKTDVRSPKALLAFCALALVVCEVQIYVVQPYRSASALDCDYVMPSGVCKGIVTVPEDESYALLEKELRALVRSEDQTILALDRAPYVYLMTNLRMAAPTPDGWYEDYAYWEEVSGLPDLILLQADRLSEKTQAFQNVLREHYSIVGTAGAFTVYRSLPCA